VFDLTLALDERLELLSRHTASATLQHGMSISDTRDANGKRKVEHAPALSASLIMLN